MSEIIIMVHSNNKRTHGIKSFKILNYWHFFRQIGHCEHRDMLIF